MKSNIFQAHEVLGNLYLFFSHYWTTLYLYSLSSISGTPANPTPLQCHGVAHFSLLCQKNDISEPTLKALLKNIYPITLSQYTGIWKRFYNWINISENTYEINH